MRKARKQNPIFKKTTMETVNKDNAEETNKAQPLRGMALIRQRELDELRRLDEEELREREYDENPGGEMTLEQRMNRVDKNKEMVLIDCTGSIVRVFDNLAQACLYFDASSHYLLEHIVTHRQIHGRLLLERSEHFEAWITNTPITFEADEDPTIHYAMLDSEFKERLAQKKNQDTKPKEDKRRTKQKDSGLGGYRYRSGNVFRRSDFEEVENGTHSAKQNSYSGTRIRRKDTGEEFASMREFAKAIFVTDSAVYCSIYRGSFKVKGISFELLPLKKEESCAPKKKKSATE